MKEIITFLMANWDTILLGVTTIVTGASIIVKLTPTPKDDAFVAKMLNVLNALALNPKK